MFRTINFTIEHGDITKFAADAVAFKYAQAFYRTDGMIARMLSEAGVAIEDLQPVVGDYRFVESRGAIQAAGVLFVGVPELRLFDYQEIREFAARVLLILYSEAPHVRHLAMTIHGAGYGLDESESMLAQFAGCLMGAQEGAVPEALQTISIVDINRDRVQRLRLALAENLLSADYAVRLEEQWGYRLKIARPERRGHAGVLVETEPGLRLHELPGARSEAKPHAFVAMPFKKEMDDVFYYGIQQPVRAAGLLCERVDQEAFTGDILNRVKERIETAAVIIADLTGANPNVYLEIGYAWGKNRPTILLVQDAEELRFDVHGQRCLTYERIKDLEDALTNELAGLKSQGVI